MTWQTACCVTANGTACANLRSKGIVEALGTVTPRERPVRKMAVVGYSVCVLNDDRSVVCAPGSSNPWRAPGVEATDLAASTGAPTYGTAFCVNAIGQGVLCYRGLGPVPQFVGKTSVELRSLAVNDLEVCGVDGGVPRCFSIPSEKRGKGVLDEGKPWTGFDASSPAVAMSSNRAGQVCALQGSRVVCRRFSAEFEKRLPAPGIALAVGKEVVCAVLEGKTSIACWHPGEGARDEEVELDRLPEGSGAIEGVVGTEHGACFLRTGGLVCLDGQRLNYPPAESPPVVAAAPKPPPPREPSEPPPKPADQDERGLTFYTALPFSFGHGHYTSNSGSGSGLWLRFRGVVAIGREETFRRRGWALGPYFEVAWHPVTGDERMASFGAGATAIWSFTRTFGLMPSVGWYSQNYPGGDVEHGLSAGIFMGLIQDSFGPLPLPIGVRLETRMGFGSQEERATLFGGEVDSIIGGVIPVFIVSWSRSMDWT